MYREAGEPLVPWSLGLRPFPEQRKSRSKIAYGEQAATSEQLEVP